MNLLDAVSRAGVVLKKVASTKGGEYAGPCPGCGGSDRFRCWPVEKGGGGSYWCRQCGKGGDNVQFLVDFLGYQYRDAFKEVGREMPDNYRPVTYRPAMDRSVSEFEPRQYEDPVETWRQKADEFVKSSHAALLDNQQQLDYLARRGLDLQAVMGFKLGWFDGENGKNCKFRPRESWGLPTELKDNGRKKMLWIPRGLVIPCFKGGKIYRIRIRRPKEDLKKKTDIKYYALPGSGHEVMGFNPGRQAFVVVEAELDAMMVTRHAGSVAGVVGLGSSAIKPGASVYYILKKALRILVALDYDKAGQAAWKWWKETFPNARFWPVPVGKDPGEAYEKGVDIKVWIMEGLPPAMTLDVNYGYQIPEGVYPMKELRMLLQKYPITIQAEETRAKINYAPGFQNKAIRKRVHDLFYGDEQIYWYLTEKHPDSLINGENCMVIKEAS